MSKLLYLAFLAFLGGCSMAYAQPVGQTIVIDFPAISMIEGKGCSSGQPCAFTIHLTEQPTANVAVSISPSPTGKTVSLPSTVGFTPSNYATPQNVLTLGRQDVDALDEYVTFTLTSSDGAPPVNVYAIVVDDEHP